MSRRAALAAATVGTVVMLGTGILAGTAARRCGGSPTVSTFATLTGVLMLGTLSIAGQRLLGWRGLLGAALLVFALQVLGALVGCVPRWLP